MNKQDYLREKCKQLRWQKEITYKTLAKDILCMNYNSFINWLHSYSKLSCKREQILNDYVAKQLTE